MFQFSDRKYVGAQYGSTSNLDARIQLHARFSTNAYGWMSWVFDQVACDLAPDCRILELGCGTGALWLENLPRVPAGWDLTLTDFSAAMVCQARSGLRDNARCTKFGQVDAQALPFPGGSFDAVIANHMLYHVPDRARALAEIHRVLCPGGQFYASTVGRLHMHELNDWATRLHPSRNASTRPYDGAFVLEDGAGELERWFSRATLRRYPDGLVVTEAGPLLAYLLSMDASTPVAPERLAEVTRQVEEELARRGAIHVTKDSGIFRAIRVQ